MPFLEQPQRFDPYWKAEHRNVLKMADSHLTVSSRYYSGVFHRRNEVLIDHCSVVVCYYDGQPGGTHYTVKLAQRQGREIINLCETQKGRSLINHG
ncbi:MAG: DUF1273 domain-containing protein [Rikenellaceae bacterium]|nr:DUF1273 domain-containing protein [Rikenellaceae bacterium]